jgi:hypothetical protein
MFDLGNLKMQTWGRYNFLPTANPDRFLMLKATGNATESHTDVIVVENWPLEFPRRQAR